MEVRRLVRVPGITCVGLHGWDWGRKNGRKRLQKFVSQLRQKVEKALEGFEGIWVEDKSIVFVVHYRRATALVARRARAALERIISSISPRIRLMEGKKVWEVLPREVKGKGAAVRALLAMQKGKPFPIYLGDDTTDEDAFKVLRRGLTVRVGVHRPTCARYELRDPDEVIEFLKRLEAQTA